MQQTTAPVIPDQFDLELDRIMEQKRALRNGAAATVGGGNDSVAPVPVVCFVINDLSCGGAQVATLRWVDALPTWVRERASVYVRHWPKGRWELAELAEARGIRVVSEPPEGVTHWVLSYGTPVEGRSGKQAAIIHQEAPDGGVRPGMECWAVSGAVQEAQARHLPTSCALQGVLYPPPQRWQCRDRWRPGSAPVRRIIFRSRLTPAKGVHVLMRILERAPDFELIVQAGVDTCHADLVQNWQRDAVLKLQAEASARGVADRLTILPFAYELNAESLRSSKADTLILLSESEGYGLVVSEAVRAGLAVVATDVGGTREAARGKATLIEYSTDPDVLADRAIEGVRDTANYRPHDEFEWACDRRGLPALLDVCGANLHSCRSLGEPPRVRVAVRFHIGGNLAWLDECMASVASQTFRCFDTILCIDGHESDAREIANRYGVRFVCTDADPCASNMSRTFLLAALASSNIPWFKPLDFDDRLMPGYLERAMDMATGRRLDLYASLMQTCDNDGTLQGIAEWPQHTPMSVLGQANKLVNPIPHLSVLMRTQTLLEVGNYAYSAPHPGDDDCDLWIRFWQAGAVMWRDSQGNCVYRLHPGQASQRH